MASDDSRGQFCGFDFVERPASFSWESILSPAIIRFSSLLNLKSKTYA